MVGFRPPPCRFLHLRLASRQTPACSRPSPSSRGPRCFCPWKLLLSLGSTDRAVDAADATAADLGLRPIHVDANRAEEVADTTMMLSLGMLRQTHLLSRHVSSAPPPSAASAPSSRSSEACGAAAASCSASLDGPLPRDASPSGWASSTWTGDIWYAIWQLPTLIRTCFLIFGARISYTIYLGSQIGMLSFLTHLGIQNLAIFSPCHIHQYLGRSLPFRLSKLNHLGSYQFILSSEIEVKPVGLYWK
jgi:hypothetical protein